MPEGQVSHRNALRLTAAMAERALVRIEAPDPRVAAQRIPELLEGDRIARVEAVGKHHLVRFDSGRVLHSHLGMVGSWRLLTARRPIPHRNLWLALWTETHVAAQYNGPRLRLYEPGAPIPGIARVGPDLLDETLDPGEVAARRLVGIDPERLVGEALMDQRVMAGIGNVIRSETLFMCGIDPFRRCGDLTADETRTVGATAARILAEGVAGGGRIATYHPVNPRSRERTWVYGRTGRPCRRCGTTIRSGGMGDANRTAYWCPVCQV
jgi:endonuclease VIII